LNRLAGRDLELVGWGAPGEEHVDTHLVRQDDSGAVHRTQIRSDTAHTGYQMRRALDRQVEEVRRVLAEHTARHQS
jgi:hypothetical protein